jgi:hypothetical protein
VIRGVEVTAIIKAGNGTTIVAPDDARNTRVSRTWRFPLCGALTGDTAENLVDDACMGNHENSLSHVRPGQSFDRSHNASSKPPIRLAPRPAEVLVGLGFILKPELGIPLSHIIYRNPVHSSTIDFGKRLQNTQGTPEVFGSCFCCVERSSERADVQSIQSTFNNETAAEQIDLLASFFRQGDIVATAQERAFVPATLNVRVTYEQKSGAPIHCAAHLSLTCKKLIKEHLTRDGNRR